MFVRSKLISCDWEQSHKVYLCQAVECWEGLCSPLTELLLTDASGAKAASENG